MKPPWIVLLLFLSIRIGYSQPEFLQSDKTIRSVFNDSEIRDLNMLLNFFEEQICFLTENSLDNRLKCFESYFNCMHECATSGNMDISISFECQKKIYSQISAETFKQIWTFGYGFRMRFVAGKWEGKEDTLKHLTFRQDGKYLIFLRKVAHHDKTIRKYYTDCITAGDMSPTMIASLLMEPEKYRIKDSKIRLIIAIHYLTVNDYYLRNERYDSPLRENQLYF